MIRYIEKGHWLHKHIASKGYNLEQLDRKWLSNNDKAVQEIIDTFDPLPYAIADALALVKEAAATKRLQYVTQSAGKDSEYVFKEKEAKQYDIDSNVGIFMQARMDATGESAKLIAAEWNAKSNAWQAIGASIAAMGDKASIDIKAETDWKRCSVLANNAIKLIEAV